MHAEDSARAASRRQHTAFRIDMPTGGAPRRQPRTKLTWTTVTEMRTWAAQAGFGIPRKVQARLLAQRVRYVAAGTVQDVLDNESWYDPTYVPGAPDATWLQMLTPIGVALTVLRRGC